MTDLQYFLNEQSRLQRVMQEKSNQDHPTDLYEALGFTTDGPEDQEAAAAITRFMQWNDKALIHELVEMEAETGWKPWAKGAFVNLEAARGEWIDMFHFMLNGALLLGLDESEIRHRYDAKHAKNEKRQEEGYNGVSTKCPNCKRALDDSAVDCILINAEHEQYKGQYQELKNSYSLMTGILGFVYCHGGSNGLYILKDKEVTA